MAAPHSPSTTPPAPNLTREALYDQVWTTPLSTLAVQWGISRSGLAKICDRLMVPYPGRGYWNVRRAERPPLPPAPAGVDTVIDLSVRAGRTRRDRTRLSPEARHEQLMAAAAGIIAREGLHAATMKRVARETGLSEAQAHNLFPRRADLLVALARRELAAMNDERQSEIERGQDNLTRVTLSTLAYLRQVAERGALIQRLLNSPEVRAGLRAEREAQSGYSRRRMTERLTTRYGVEADLARGATVVLTAVCLRAGRLLAEGKIPLSMAERLSLAIVTGGNREIVREYRG
ncbi:MAG: TetR family transcriptional regulator [Phenylobacterium sp.]|uniref:TetR/AcrR family transcriptional regulator n=1 Tax=Phenylobacterium sp. TaxID=1871053 RepID=UPI00271BE7DC|nr:TetR family transcriptional regulator [Phenylobacterium sp.]MDO8900840.1 TetR family transcriptional regulator [Phenylobacterium sp.]MDP2212930.1 TetR family transcriptional regulator [Phenylobacterium sp.]